jgi:primary-amine oxidase
MLINPGSRVRQSTQGVIHDHIMNFKLDFDILGVENSFETQTLKTKTEYSDWADDDTGFTTSYLETQWVENEDDARLEWPSNGDAMFLVGMSTLNNTKKPFSYSV